MNRPVNLLRRALPWLAIAAGAAILYDGWTFYSRWKAARDGEAASKAAEALRAQQSIDALGGTDFRIMTFYASPREIRAGSQAQLCFGVFGAKTVRIEPEPGDVHPAINNCLQVAPKRDTEYRLTAADAGGKSIRATATIKVLR